MKRIRKKVLVLMMVIAMSLIIGYQTPYNDRNIVVVNIFEGSVEQFMSYNIIKIEEDYSTTIPNTTTTTTISSKLSGTEVSATRDSNNSDQKVATTTVHETKPVEATKREKSEATTTTTTVVTTTTPTVTTVETTADTSWNGRVLTRNAGVVQGPSGKETWYNLDMSRVIQTMKNLGYNYEYWIREDGVKMFGDYVMVAANLDLRPKGTLVQTSLGMGIVCDTGGFASGNPTQLDIAVDW